MHLQPTPSTKSKAKSGGSLVILVSFANGIEVNDAVSFATTCFQLPNKNDKVFILYMRWLVQSKAHDPDSGAVARLFYLVSPSLHLISSPLFELGIPDSLKGSSQLCISARYSSTLQGVHILTSFKKYCSDENYEIKSIQSSQEVRHRTPFPTEILLWGWYMKRIHGFFEWQSFWHLLPQAHISKNTSLQKKMGLMIQGCPHTYPKRCPMN